MSATSAHSTTATWNWRGRQTTAANASRVWATKPTGGALATSARVASASGIARASSQNMANTPIATSATSLTSDSSATASIRPGRCSVASTCRVPKRIANSAISAATYSAGSPQTEALALRPPSTSRLIATALNCSARYGTAAISAINATSAATCCERP